MRSRSKLISYETEDVPYSDFTNNYGHDGTKYFQYSRSTNPATVGQYLVDAFSVFPQVYIGDIPTYKSGSYYWRDDAAVMQRLSEHLSGVCLPQWVASSRTANTGLYTVTFLKSVHLKHMVDVVNAGFRKKSQAGEVIMTPMNSQETKVDVEIRRIGGGETSSATVIDIVQSSSVKRVRFRCSYENKIKGYGWPAEKEDFLHSLLSFTLMDRQAAVNSAFDAITSADFDLPVFIAESGDVVRTIARSAMGIYSIIRAIKRFEFQHLAPTTWRKFLQNGKRENADVLADAWLEARYAWRPLISDVESGVKYLRNDRKEITRRTFRGFTDDTSSTTVSTSTTATVNSYTMSLSLDLTGEISQVARAGVMVELSSNLVGARGLGFTDVSGVVWELVPFSFVIDWFVNVKGILASLNPSVGYDQRGTFASVRGNHLLSGTFDCTYRSVTVSDLSLTLTRVQYDRSVDNKRSFSPILDVNFDIYKVVDSVALLWSLR